MTKIATKSVWCDECKLKVFECEHLAGKDAGAEVPDDIPADRRRVQTVFLAFNSRVHGKATANIVANTQLDVKPMRLVVDPLVADNFMILDIRTGNYSNFASSTGGGVSSAIFPPTPPKYQPVANLAGLPIIKVGQCMVLSILNRNPALLEFNALVWCDTKIEEPRSVDLDLEDMFKKRNRTKAW